MINKDVVKDYNLLGKYDCKAGYKYSNRDQIPLHLCAFRLVPRPRRLVQIRLTAGRCSVALYIGINVCHDMLRAKIETIN